MRTLRIVLAILAVVLSLALTGCGSTQTHSRVTVTSTIAAATTTSAPAPKSTTSSGHSSSTTVRAQPAQPAAKPQRFVGVGSENLGTITVPIESTLSWSCPSCGSANYQIFTSDPYSSISVNGLDVTSGKTVITAGTYPGVTVNTEAGDWVFTITPGNSTQTPESPPAASAQTPATTGGDPSHVVSDYWKGINEGDFHTAYSYLAPGQQSESAWVSSHQADRIQSATFSGTNTGVGSTTATVHVDFLQTQDQTKGCQTWSGSYQMIQTGGVWLIAKAGITPRGCAGAGPALPSPRTTSAPSADFCTTHTCIPNFPNGNGYIVQCADGEWSHSGGLSGACSGHGGET